MKRIFSSILLTILLISTQCFAAWDASKPTDSEKLKDTPALIRANWDAIATGTNSALLITNAKVSSSAAIVDTKLATISTAGKVDGTAITDLPGIPSGAGALLIANGGTGQTTRNPALNALLPSQSSASGKALISNGTDTSFGYPGGLNISSQSQGDVIYFNGTSWVRLAAGTSGALLKTNGTGANPAWLSDIPVTNLDSGTNASSSTFWRGDGSWSSASGSLFISGSTTWTAPTGITRVFLTMCGGGAGGGNRTNTSGSGGGASGACLRDVPYAVTGGSSYTVTIGAFGTGGANGGANDGADGGTTTFDALSVLGGKGGKATGAGGLAPVTNIPSGTTAGLQGDFLGVAGAAGAGTAGGGGGGCPYGAGGAGGASSGTTGGTATGYCAGGGGGGQNASAGGGNGSPGFANLRW